MKRRNRENIYKKKERKKIQRSDRVSQMKNKWSKENEKKNEKKKKEQNKMKIYEK